ncbi:GntR family transcriptional regulator [Heyndrickxia oleronia]|jgi:GntR family transcriptional regulator|uniref:GntR family transcriptional regulator n=1 Tax=Heyndrickxia oleronia TaxID=38875 RepID=UPI00217F0612|nr:GntR family transcriptional regulator [Heyndrickxia oleronia]MCI1589001.1 GntR family transcriptional regulator [Heyndrickxia oleronia]MCI1611907.1 GntR family transcriptional regulator [Heyndrickxia oleronia]MCI1743086.1 GntR family transcriptional regulator [Heyndrickxia oleronia]MCI1759580.1 GntR family transcriptional regulator [Heyndrickxia oleronia]
MKVNKNLPTPLYHQVKDYLEEKIILGEWDPGYQLPTEKELSAQFQVSTITVKRAIHDLVNKGILYRQRGKGTFVSSKEDKDIYQLVSLRNEAGEDKHHPHKSLSFKEEEAGVKIGKMLNIDAKDKVYKIHRLKIEEDTPVGIEYTYIPSSLFPGLTEKMIEDNLFYNVFTNKYGMNLEKAKIFFSTIIADEYESALLNISKGEQLFVLERFTHTEDQKIIEYSRFIIRQEKSRYYIEIRL